VLTLEHKILYKNKLVTWTCFVHIRTRRKETQTKINIGKYCSLIQNTSFVKSAIKIKEQRYG